MILLYPFHRNFTIVNSPHCYNKVPTEVRVEKKYPETTFDLNIYSRAEKFLIEPCKRPTVAAMLQKRSISRYMNNIHINTKWYISYIHDSKQPVFGLEQKNLTLPENWSQIHLTTENPRLSFGWDRSKSCEFQRCLSPSVSFCRFCQLSVRRVSDHFLGF